MQAMLSDQQGRTLIVEPGIGWREGDGRYSLITNYSILAPESTMPFLVPGDDRYERAAQLLKLTEISLLSTMRFLYFKPSDRKESGPPEFLSFIR